MYLSKQGKVSEEQKVSKKFQLYLKLSKLHINIIPMNKIFVSSKTLQNLTFDVISTHNVLMYLGHFIFRDKIKLTILFLLGIFFFRKKETICVHKFPYELKLSCIDALCMFRWRGKKSNKTTQNLSL